MSDQYLRDLIYSMKQIDSTLRFIALGLWIYLIFDVLKFIFGGS